MPSTPRGERSAGFFDIVPVAVAAAPFGLLLGAVLIGITLGPVAFGYTYEGMGSYVDVLWVGVGFNVLAILLMATLGPFPTWGTAERAADAPARAEASPAAG